MTLWRVVCQVSLSLEFSRQEYWSGLPCPPQEDLPDPGMEPRSESPGEPKNTGEPFLSPGDLPDPGIKLGSPALKVNSLPVELPRKHKEIA